MRRLAVTMLALAALGPCARHLPHDRDRDGYVTCAEWDRPDPRTDLPCGFQDGEPVG